MTASFKFNPPLQLFEVNQLELTEFTLDYAVVSDGKQRWKYPYGRMFRKNRRAIDPLVSAVRHCPPVLRKKILADVMHDAINLLDTSGQSFPLDYLLFLESLQMEVWGNDLDPHLSLNLYHAIKNRSRPSRPTTSQVPLRSSTQTTSSITTLGTEAVKRLRDGKEYFFWMDDNWNRE